MTHKLSEANMLTLEEVNNLIALRGVKIVDIASELGLTRAWVYRILSGHSKMITEEKITRLRGVVEKLADEDNFYSMKLFCANKLRRAISLIPTEYEIGCFKDSGLSTTITQASEFLVECLEEMNR